VLWWPSAHSFSKVSSVLVVYADDSMSKRMNAPVREAAVSMRPRFSARQDSEIACPSWVNLSETFPSSPAWAMRSSTSAYTSAVRRACTGSSTASPR